MEGIYRASQVAWERVVQPKEQGGLGVIDPMLKAKVLQGMWVICILAPGLEPWKPWFQERLSSALPVPGGVGALVWVMSVDMGCARQRLHCNS